MILIWQSVMVWFSPFPFLQRSFFYGTAGDFEVVSPIALKKRNQQLEVELEDAHKYQRETQMRLDAALREITELKGTSLDP